MRKKINIILSILLPIQWIFIRWISNYPHQVETYYSEGIYPKIAIILQTIFGWIPFSLGDILYFFFGIWCVYMIYRLLKDKRRGIKTNLLRITSALSILYFAFHFLWAINYYRPPLYYNLGLEATYTTEELYTTTKKLIYNTNKLHNKLTISDSIISSPYSKKEIRNIAFIGYKNVSEKITPNIQPPQSIKNSLYSLPISYLGYGGYFNPFTGEAQINAKTPETLYAVIATHEQAHQLGYAAENEANFIGVIASIQNPETFMQYAGYSYGLRYCLNELSRRDKELYNELYKTVAPGTLAMYKSHYEFWKKYDTPIEDISKFVWDKFLKVSKQKDGITSYSYIVALLVNYDKHNPTFFE